MQKLVITLSNIATGFYLLLLLTAILLLLSGSWAGVSALLMSPILIGLIIISLKATSEVHRSKFSEASVTHYGFAILYAFPMFLLLVISGSGLTPLILLPLMLFHAGIGWLAHHLGVIRQHGSVSH